jgi:hypothetical protein
MRIMLVAAALLFAPLSLAGAQQGHQVAKPGVTVPHRALSEAAAMKRSTETKRTSAARISSAQTRARAVPSARTWGTNPPAARP